MWTIYLISDVKTLSSMLAGETDLVDTDCNFPGYLTSPHGFSYPGLRHKKEVKVTMGDKSLDLVSFGDEGHDVR